MKYFKYKLKLNQEERSMLTNWIGINRCLWNLALRQRDIVDYRELKLRGETPLNYNFQSSELVKLKQEFEFFKEPPAQSLQQTLMDLEGAFKRFWKGLGSYPRYKKKSSPTGMRLPKGNSKKKPDGNFQFPEHANPKKGYLKLPKVVKPLRFFKHREMEGEIRSVTIRKESQDFFISVLCDIKDKYENVVNPNNTILGIDRGIAKSFALSDGKFIKLPKKKIKYLESKISKFQTALSIKNKFSNNWKKVKNKISKIHQKISLIRKDFLWKVAHYLSKSHAVIGLEKLKTSNMSKSSKGTLENPGKNVAAKSGLNRSILREGWSMFAEMLAWECKKNGSQLMLVDPKNTSITCSKCKKKDKKFRKSQAVFECICGFRIHADLNSAFNIEDIVAAACSGSKLCGCSHPIRSTFL